MAGYQLGIIGGGPGGYVCALRAAQLGLKTVLVEGERVGGTCLNKGCIPTKALVRSAEVWREVQRASEFGVTVKDSALDYAAVMNRKRAVVENLVNGVETLLRKAKVDVIHGWASVSEPGRIAVQTAGGVEEVEAENIVLATGSEPVRIPVPGSDLPGVMTSDEFLEETTLPSRLVIIGGGVIGMEFACIYHALGVKVMVVEALPRILPNVDEDVSKRLTPLLKRQGIDLFTGAQVEEIKQGTGQLEVVFNDGKSRQVLQAERVLLATGRRPNLRGIDVDKLGLKLEGKAIAVNDRCETSVPGIYAIGDVTGRIMLAHVASMEGIAVAERLVGRDLRINYGNVPNVIFTYPEVAVVGPSEQDLKAQGRKFTVSRFPFSANGKAMTLGETAGFVKIIADEQGVICGASIMGPQAGNLIQELVVAIEKRVTGEELAHIIHAHPTLPEAVMEAAHGIGSKPLHLA